MTDTRIKRAREALREPAPSPVVMLKERWPREDEYPVLPGHVGAVVPWVHSWRAYCGDREELAKIVAYNSGSDTPCNAWISIAGGAR